MSTDANKDLARSYFAAFLARDEAWWQRHIAPDFVRHDPGLDFAVQIDGEDRPDILLVPGLDDILLSLTPANGDLAIDLAFLSTIVGGKNLQITGYRDGSIEALASYDIAELAAGLGRCGIR